MCFVTGESRAPRNVMRLRPVRGPAVADQRVEAIEAHLERWRHGFQRDERGGCAVCGLGVVSHLPPEASTLIFLLSLVRTQAAEIERLRAVETDLHHIIGVLGPDAPAHGCEGCAYEMGEALKYARAAIARLRQEESGG